MFARLVIVLAIFALLGCASSEPAWKADERMSHQLWDEARAAWDAGDKERAHQLARLSRMHFDQAQRIYLIELQADRNMRAGVAAAAIQAYGAQQSAIIGAGAAENSGSARSVCVPSGSAIICP